MHRARVLLLCFVFLAGACTTESETPPPGAAATDTPPTELRCRLGPAVSEGLTFSSGGHVFAADLAGGEPLCVAEAASGPLEWGAVGDRLLAGSDVLVGRSSVAIEAGATSIGWSRPTGTAVVYVTADGRLEKIDVATGDVEDISFLERHDAVTYHPAGTHIAVSGEDRRGVFGLFLATNVGKDVQQLARGEDAETIASLAFSHDGNSLFFVAQHESELPEFHLHRLILDQGFLDTIRVTELPIGHLAINDFASSVPEVAFTIGSCEEQADTFVYRNYRVRRIDGATWGGGAATPVGWLSDGRLALLVSPQGDCAPAEQQLYLWDGAESIVVADGVDPAGGAAVRAVLPPPPKPPRPVKDVVA